MAGDKDDLESNNGITTELPDPGELGMEGHAQMSRRFLEHARLYLEQGDRIQASEKVWGAAAHALKAVGEQRGWDHRGHSNVLFIGEHLGREFDREALFLRYISQAESMHINFYENRREENVINRALLDVEMLVAELDAVRNSPPRPYRIKDESDRRRLGRLLGLRRGDRPAIGDYSPVGYSQTHRA